MKASIFFLPQGDRPVGGGFYTGFRWMLLGILLLGFSTESAGQQLSLSGTVRDADGVVADATVTLRAAGAEPVTAGNLGVELERGEAVQPRALFHAVGLHQPGISWCSDQCLYYQQSPLSLREVNGRRR